MTANNRIIINQATGQQIEFLNTSNEHTLEMETVYMPFSNEPAVHYHPHQEELFTVLTGSLQVRIERQIISLRSGDSLRITKGQRHSMWNSNNVPTKVNWKVAPAMKTEEFLKTFTKVNNIAQDRNKSTPNILQMSTIAAFYSQEVRLAQPAYLIQIIFFRLLKPLAKVLGYKSTHL